MANFTCPDASPGSWHSCADGSRFVGCCTQDDPCELGCSAGNLVAASFNTAIYGKFPDLECGVGAQFYTCNFTDPPFWGCCKSNPCLQDGCPTEDLSAANLGVNPQATIFYSPTGTSVLATADTQSNSLSKNTVVKAAVAGAIGGAILVGIVVFLLCRRVRRRRQAETSGARFDAKGSEAQEGYAAIPTTTPMFYHEPPPPLFFTYPQHGSNIHGLGHPEQRKVQSAPAELTAEPVVPIELDAGSASAQSENSAGATATSRLEESRLPAIKEQQCTVNDTDRDAPEISPLSATFTENTNRAHWFSGTSSQSLSPRTSFSPPPQYSPAIKETESPTDGPQN